jgi:hypothetical protein
LLHTAELNAATVKNLVSGCEVGLDLLTALLDLSNVFANFLLVDGIVDLLLLLHTFSGIYRPVQLNRPLLVFA